MGLSGVFFFFKAEGGIGDDLVTGVQTCALPICRTATYSPLAYERIQLDGLHARRSFEIRGIDSTQTLHSDTDAAVLPGNTAPWLFSRTQYANGLGSAVRISPCRLTALALVRGVIRASAQSDLAMRELVLLTHAIQRRSSAGADCSWPALDARGGAPVWETPQAQAPPQRAAGSRKARDRKSTRLNSSHQIISYAVFC